MERVNTIKDQCFLVEKHSRKQKLRGLHSDKVSLNKIQVGETPNGKETRQLQIS